MSGSSPAPTTPVRSYTYTPANHPNTTPTAHRLSKLPPASSRSYSQHDLSSLSSSAASSPPTSYSELAEENDEETDAVSHEEQYAVAKDQLLASLRNASDLVQSVLTFNDRHPLAVPSDHIPTVPSSPASSAGSDDVADPLSILKVALTHSANRQIIPSQSLARNTLASLLGDRLKTSARQLTNLSSRVADTQSKVLVTGDLNAGKSTFVNALLRKKVMPTDQQPCTTVFCEVLDAEALNGGKEQVHVLKRDVPYNIEDAATYDVRTVEDLEQIVSDAEDLPADEAPILKCYALDARETHASFLRNGLVDIALIDAPGLNRDSVKTTALFARQEEIDVIVFVVSAENHFTLSAREFLQFASNDKAYIYVVVNKYDTISNKAKCRRIVLDQVKLLSPKTYEHHSQLVHFVDSDAVARVMGISLHDVDSEDDLLRQQQAAQDEAGEELRASLDAFAKLESSLRHFVLRKRAVSKLAPAQVYLDRLLTDMSTLAAFNQDTAEAELAAAQDKLAELKPKLERLAQHFRALEAALEGEEDEIVNDVQRESQQRLTQAVELVGKGQSAVPSKVPMPEWPGFGYVLEYAADVRLALIQSLEAALSQAEDKARTQTADAVIRIQALGKSHMPKEEDGIEMQPDQRKFRPELMFTKRTKVTSKQIGGRGSSMPGLGGALAGLRLGADVEEVRPSDIFDAMYHVHILLGHNGDGSEKSAKKAITNGEEDSSVSLLSTMFFGFGAASVLGGSTFGAKGAIDTVVRVADLMGNQTARKWAGPACAVVSVGLVTYFIWDLPQAIPRNVGRSLKAELMVRRRDATASSSRKQIAHIAAKQTAAPQTNTHGGEIAQATESALVAVAAASTPSASSAGLDFIAAHTAQLTREVRKVLRVAAWGQLEIFRRASDGLERECKSEERKVEGAEEAVQWSTELGEKAVAERVVVRSIEIEKMA
ncbi:mitofusin [Tilletia horrida]|uniref:Mitofusin n=1 Tax=Tilletia horrida TaxID=155126 RepID=A0AAN6GRX4_9BASI|nr:mitofusin [Tilletia horrida]KAK0566354.1 mitofusin [Tilletia horrida]